MNSEEDEPQVEAALTDSPDSKDSWLRSPHAPNEQTGQLQDVKSEKNTNCQEATTSQIHDDLETMVKDKTGTKETSEAGKDELHVEEMEESGDKRASACDVTEEITKMNISVDQIESSNSTSDCSSLALSAKDSIEHMPCGYSDVKVGELTTPIKPEDASEDDDDFGDFEEAAETNDQIRDECDNEEFGEFSDGPNAAASANLQSTSSVIRTDASPNVASSLLGLKGMDFTCSVANALRAIASDRFAMPGEMSELGLSRNLKLTACTESRFGVHLLYPRPVPAGFLRSSGVPVLLSSQITTAEQRLLNRLGLQEAYVSAQKAEAFACQAIPLESISQASASPTPSKELGSEVQSANEDLNLDLDFLVQFSNQQLTGSAGSSNNGTETSRHEELTRHSNLHELFSGIVESSQSSAFSLSSGLSDNKHEDNQLLTPTLRAEPSTVQPCLKEDEWDAFVDAAEAPIEASTGNNCSRDKDSIPEELNVLKTEISNSVVRKDDEAGAESDIFSGEWLNQLRSSRDAPSLDDSPAILSVETSKPACLLESEWGTFVDAPSNQAMEASNTSHFLMAASHDQSHQSPSSHSRTLVDCKPSVPVLMTDLSDQWTGLNALAMDRVTLMEPTVQLLEEDEWGGFQG